MQPTLFAPTMITVKIFPPPPYKEQALQHRLQNRADRFPPADKADMIAQLWAAPPEPDVAINGLARPHGTLGLGLALCDRMAQNGELMAVPQSLACAAHKVLLFIASGAMQVAQPPLEHLARLCYMALKCQVIQPDIASEAALRDVGLHFCQLAQRPAKFSAIADAGEQVDWHVLHQGISLLCAPHDNVLVSPTVLYNPLLGQHQRCCALPAR